MPRGLICHKLRLERSGTSEFHCYQSIYLALQCLACNSSTLTTPIVEDCNNLMAPYCVSARNHTDRAISASIREAYQLYQVFAVLLDLVDCSHSFKPTNVQELPRTVKQFYRRKDMSKSQPVLLWAVAEGSHPVVCDWSLVNAAKEYVAEEWKLLTFMRSI